MPQYRPAPGIEQSGSDPRSIPLRWSSYNTTLSGGQGHFLYNALSNTLFELDETHQAFIAAIRSHTGEHTSAAAPDPCFSGSWVQAAQAESGLGTEASRSFVAALRQHKILVEPEEERRLLLAGHHALLARKFDTSSLSLTICPTLACNFRCPYCFESSQNDGTRMSPETMDRLMDFIAGYTQIHRLDVSWFGGEPLLGWDRIVALTQRFQALPIRYGGAGILTNGYLLDQEKIARLDELQIVSIQITLDGPAEVHDTRRILAGGGPTFSRIMGNLDTLAASEWKGTLSIRVNIDSTNAEQFAGLRAALLGHFKGMPLMVYPAQVTADPGAGCTADACLDSAAWARYILDLYRQNGIVPYGGFHPQANQSSICVATSLNGFVVGPSGELYKCTEDVGDPGMVVGNVHARPPITNPSLQALYSCGTDAYTDRECLACPTLPICGGGCARRRLHTKHLGIPSPEFCSPHLHSLHAFLEAYIDTVRIRETIAAFLTPDSPVLHEAGTAAIQPPSHSAGWRVTQGWRVLSPQATAPVASVGEPPAC